MGYERKWVDDVIAYEQALAGETGKERKFRYIIGCTFMVIYISFLTWLLC